MSTTMVLSARRAMALALILMMVFAPTMTAFAADSGERFNVSAIGLSIVIDDAYIDQVKAGKISFFPRTDSAVKTDGLAGYGTVYLTPDLSSFSAQTYDEAEQWLGEYCTPIAVIAAFEGEAAWSEADIAARFHGFAAQPVGSTQALTYVLLRPDAPPTAGLDDEQAAWVEAVWQSMADEGRFEWIDIAGSGVLGPFQTKDLNGEPIDHTFVKDAKLTIVDFWGTFCSPCIEEMPMLSALSEALAGDGIQFLGVITDGYDEGQLDLAREIVAATGSVYRHIPPVVSQELMASMQFIPTKIFIDAEGQMVGEPVVGGMTEAQLRAEIDARLAMLG